MNEERLHALALPDFFIGKGWPGTDNELDAVVAWMAAEDIVVPSDLAGKRFNIATYTGACVTNACAGLRPVAQLPGAALLTTDIREFLQKLIEVQLCASSGTERINSECCRKRPGLSRRCRSATTFQQHRHSNDSAWIVTCSRSVQITGDGSLLLYAPHSHDRAWSGSRDLCSRPSCWPMRPRPCWMCGVPSPGRLCAGCATHYRPTVWTERPGHPGLALRRSWAVAPSPSIALNQVRI